MDGVVNKLQSLADAILNSPEAAASFPMLTSTAASPEYCAILARLIVDRLAETNRSMECGISAAMALFESFNNPKNETSLFLICNLFSIASDHYMHDVCDAIDLWISNGMTPRLSSYLQELAQIQDDQDVGSHFILLAHNEGIV